MGYPTLEKRTEYQARWRRRKMEAYIAEHGHPTCECGCGTPVKFDRLGQPRRFINTHQGSTADVTAANAARIGEFIPAGEFAEAVKRLRDKRGWTWQQMADAGGTTLGTLSGVVFGKQKRVRKRWARQFLANIHAHDQERLRREAHRSLKREQHYPGAGYG